MVNNRDIQDIQRNNYRGKVILWGIQGTCQMSINISSEKKFHRCKFGKINEQSTTILGELGKRDM